MEEIFAAKSRQNICRVFAPNNDFPYGNFHAGNIGGGAGGGNIWLARHHAGRMPQAKVCGGMNAVPSPGQ